VETSKKSEYDINCSPQNVTYSSPPSSNLAITMSIFILPSPRYSATDATQARNSIRKVESQVSYVAPDKLLMGGWIKLGKGDKLDDYHVKFPSVTAMYLDMHAMVEDGGMIVDLDN
jgi:hypothetical protein